MNFKHRMTMMTETHSMFRCITCKRSSTREIVSETRFTCPSCSRIYSFSYPYSSLSLCIIAKSVMYENYCYIGYDQEDDCLVRPIYRTTEKSWESEFDWDIKRWYSFEAQEMQNITAHPHQLEDVVVSRKVIRGGLYEADLIRKLIPHCTSSIKEAYGDSLQEENEKHYVIENAECPSVGLVKILKDSLKFYGDETRVKIDKWNYPITMEDKELVIANVERNEVILITGLARPFSGNNRYDQRRCYVMIVGILEIPGNDNSDIKKVEELLKKLIITKAGHSH